ncbi:hypothetical protein B0G62_10398 [Paraburkholderia eburnea]|uniref:Uncharacterized protein n=2 Tax=Paraburkholderia eburnea TaxID=1189126 RepID=A0A2S4MFK6_9BURK|nr:hypothetical protein B0G62_10398 [Paraburkholderia eburnea]PRZ25494.1 hypothetical protein BX588_10298 [Paraburkholderia eburnea]
MPANTTNRFPERPFSHPHAASFRRLAITAAFVALNVPMLAPASALAATSEATPSTPSTVTQPIARPGVWYVTRLAHADRAEDDKVRAHLESLGLAVTMVDQSAPVADARGARLVIISSVVSARDMVGTAYRDIGVPLLTWESDLFDSLRFTGQRKGVDFGEMDKEHYVNVVNAPSPLAGGVAAGKRWVYPRDGEMGWGRPAPGATVVATIPGEPEHAVMFGYEKGATMDYDFIAPARRVALFLGNRSFEHLSPDGQAMFDAAVQWALTGAPADARQP